MKEASLLFRKSYFNTSSINWVIVRNAWLSGSFLIFCAALKDSRWLACSENGYLDRLAVAASSSAPLSSRVGGSFNKNVY